MSEPRNNRQQQHFFWCRATVKPVWFNELPEVGFTTVNKNFHQISPKLPKFTHTLI